MVFSERPIRTLPTRKPYDYAIDLKPDFKSVIQKPFHLDQKQNEAVRKFISTLPCPHIPGGFQVECFCSIYSAMDSIYSTMESIHSPMDSIYSIMDSIHSP